MKPEDSKQFRSMLAGVYALYNKDLSEAVLSIWWEAMRPFGFVEVKNALNRHAVNPDNGQFIPKPADVVRIIGDAFDDGRPGAEEAWAMVAQTIGNEAITIVWTQEMSEAWGIARQLENDRVAARMAFLERYRALLKKAREQNIPVQWTPSLGTDHAGRTLALMDAQQKGRLSVQHVAGLLPYRDEPTPRALALINGGKA